MGNGPLIMYNCAVIKEMTHTNEKHWYFPLRAIFIFGTGSLQQHDISGAPGHMVPHPALPGVSAARDTDEVWGRPRGGGVLKTGAESFCTSISSISLRAHYMLSSMHISLAAFLELICPLCAKSPPALCVHRLTCTLLTSMFVWPCPCVLRVVLGAGRDTFSALAPDWRQWPFILHCPT